MASKNKQRTDQGKYMNKNGRLSQGKWEEKRRTDQGKINEKYRKRKSEEINNWEGKK